VKKPQTPENAAELVEAQRERVVRTAREVA
jgi:hypothetical protein